LYIYQHYKWEDGQVQPLMDYNYQTPYTDTGDSLTFHHSFFSMR